MDAKRKRTSKKKGDTVKNKVSQKNILKNKINININTAQEKKKRTRRPKKKLNIMGYDYNAPRAVGITLSSMPPSLPVYNNQLLENIYNRLLVLPENQQTQQALTPTTIHQHFNQPANQMAHHQSRARSVNNPLPSKIEEPEEEYNYEDILKSRNERLNKEFGGLNFEQIDEAKGEENLINPIEPIIQLKEIYKEEFKEPEKTFQEKTKENLEKIKEEKQKREYKKNFDLEKFKEYYLSVKKVNIDGRFKTQKAIRENYPLLYDIFMAKQKAQKT